MESVNPPGVEDSPSPMIHESYQDVVVSGVVGIVVVVGGNVVVVIVVVVIAIVVDDNLNLCCRRRIRAILSRLSRSALSREFGEDPLLLPTTRLLPLPAAGCCALVVL